jgi:pre-mRNA-splicing factor ATP-dependent RNA helicase DHX15/PRP43
MLIASFQDIADTYYDINTFPKGDIRSALERTMDKIRRKKQMKGRK